MEHCLRMIADSVPGIAFVSRSDGALEYMSPRFYEYAGPSDDASPSAAMRNAIHPADRDQTLAQWRAGIASGESFQTDCRLRRKDGQYRWFRMRSRPISLGGDFIERWFAICFCIDDLRAPEAVHDQTVKLAGAVPSVSAETEWSVDTARSIFADIAHNRWGDEQHQHHPPQSHQPEPSKLTQGDLASEMMAAINEPLTAAANYARATASLIEVGSPAELAKACKLMGEISEQLVRAGRMVHRIYDARNL